MKFNIDFLNTLPFMISLILVIGFGCLIFATIFLIIALIDKFFSRERIEKRWDRYCIIKGYGSSKKYLTHRWGSPDWTYNNSYADNWPTREAALQHLTRPPGPYRKWKQKKEYQRIKAEQEARLKAHQEKMLKVRLDFSNYGCEEKDC